MKMKMKNRNRNNYLSNRIPKMERLVELSIEEDMNKWKIAYFAVGNAQWCTLKNSLRISYKIESTLTI